MDYANNVSRVWEGIEQIENSLDRQISPLIDTSTSTGQRFVVAGYSQSRQALYAVDPSLPTPTVRIVAFGELENNWNSSSKGFDKRAAVFPQRHRIKN